MSRSFIAAGLCVAGSVAIMIASVGSTDPVFESGPLVEGLSDRVNDVTSVRLALADRTATIRRLDDGSWGVEELSDYPANYERIKQLIVGLGESEVFEAKTRRQERHIELGLAGVENGSPTMSIEMRDSAGGEVASVLIGDLGPSQNVGRRFVRQSDADDCYLAYTPRLPEMDPKSWADRALSRMPVNEVRQMDRVLPDGMSFRFVRDSADSVFGLTGLAPDLSAVLSPDNSGTRSLAGAMTSVVWDEVELLGDEQPTPIEEIVFTLFEGRRIIWTRIEGERRVVIRAEYLPIGEADQAVVDEVTTFNERHGPWVYTLADATMTLLFPPAERLVSGLEPEVGAEAPLGPVAPEP
ncbi:MAG: DUF4340 domain-containing protein [Planctomycetota bacterium]